MRDVLKNLWNEIINPDNEDKLFDMFSLFSLIINKNISDEELRELMEYSKC